MILGTDKDEAAAINRVLDLVIQATEERSMKEWRMMNISISEAAEIANEVKRLRNDQKGEA